MENFEILKSKLTRAINEISDKALIEKVWKFLQENKNSNHISEPASIYDSEKPMTEEEVEEYFREETAVLPQEIMDIIKISQEQIKNGEYYTNEEVEKYFDEWLQN